jgi:hypothetical protein
MSWIIELDFKSSTERNHLINRGKFPRGYDRGSRFSQIICANQLSPLHPRGNLPCNQCGWISVEIIQEIFCKHPHKAHS